MNGSTGVLSEKPYVAAPENLGATATAHNALTFNSEPIGATLTLAPDVSRRAGT